MELQMAQLAYLYDVRVRLARKPDSFQLMGDCLGRGGIWFGDAVNAELREIDESGLLDEDATTAAVFERALPTVNSVQDMVGCSVLLHEVGVRSIMRLRAAGQSPVPRTEDDSEICRLGIAVHLPQDRRAGTLVVHRSNAKSAARAAKGAIRKAARSIGAVAEITPRVLDADLLRAVQDDRIIAVDMRPASNQAGWSARTGTGRSEVEFSFKVHARRGLLRVPDVVKSTILRNDPHVNVSLNGTAYDEIRVTVELENGRKRTFTVGAADRGIAFAYDLDLGSAQRDDYGPAPAPLARALAAML